VPAIARNGVVVLDGPDRLVQALAACTSLPVRKMAASEVGDLARLAHQGVPPAFFLWHPIAGAGDACRVQDLLLEASRHGIVTNALAYDGAWGKKDELELTLRAYERATKRRICRPETYVAARPQLDDVVAHFAARGLDCIVKPANGARGESIFVVTAGQRTPSVASGNYVVQALVPNPLLDGGRKIDFRFYLLVDASGAGGSRLCHPIFVRKAGVAYARGRADAEITNCAYRCRHTLEGGMAPLDQPALAARIAALADDLLTALAWWYEVPERTVGPRVQLWGVDAIADVEHHVRLLEVNVFPDLFMGSELCDGGIERIIVEDYWPALSRCGEGVT